MIYAMLANILCHTDMPYQKLNKVGSTYAESMQELQEK